jgi:cytochrome c5
MDHDRKFFDTFMLVLGVLLGITIALFFIANALAESELDINNRENPVAMTELEKRLAPVGQVATDAPAETSAAPAAAPAAVQVAMAPAAAPAPAAPAKVDGKAIYEQACAMCHGTGLAGAPKPGDKANWAPRIKQGTATLYDHAIKGFTGAAGMMPAKGGRMDFSDDQVKAAVDHMVAASK